MVAERRFYVFLFLACMVGYGWLWFSLHLTGQQEVTVCLFKGVTQVPCPSCGSTRALQALWQGQFGHALHLNPLSVILFVVMAIAPVWILWDWSFRKHSLFAAYRYVERLLQRKVVYIPLIALVLTNWMWNIVKGL